MRPLGSRKICTIKIFRTTGARITSANGTKNPVTKNRPQTISVPFRRMKKYFEAWSPAKKVAISPVSGGGVVKKKAIPPKRKRAPRRHRTAI
jgi:hypothetical protein